MEKIEFQMKIYLGNKPTEKKKIIKMEKISEFKNNGKNNGIRILF